MVLLMAVVTVCVVVVMRGGTSFGHSALDVPYLLLSLVSHMGCLTWNVRARVCCHPNQSPSWHQGERPQLLQCTVAVFRA